MMKKAKRPMAAMLSLLMAVVLVMSGMPIKAEAEGTDQASPVKKINVQYDEPAADVAADFDIEVTQTGGIVKKVTARWSKEDENGTIDLEPGNKFEKGFVYWVSITVILSEAGNSFASIFDLEPTMNHMSAGSCSLGLDDWTLNLSKSYTVGEVSAIEKVDIQFKPQIGSKLGEPTLTFTPNAMVNSEDTVFAMGSTSYTDVDWSKTVEVGPEHIVNKDRNYILVGTITLDGSDGARFTADTKVYVNGELLDVQVTRSGQLYVEYMMMAEEPVVEEVSITIDAPVFGETCAFEASSLTEGVDVSNVFWLAGVSPQLQLQDWHQVMLDETVEAGYWYAALIEVTSDMVFAPDFKTVINNGSEDVINVMAAIEDDNHEAVLAVYWYVVPVMTSGSSYEYTQESGKDVTITCNGNYDDFVTVLVDDVSLEEGDFTVEKGSTIVTIKAETLDKMAVGDHKVAFEYAGGLSEEVVLKIQAAAADDSGNSSDESSDTNSSDTDSSSGSESSDDSSKDESSKDESSKDESSKDESSKDDSSKDESPKNEGSKGESSDAASSGNESSGNGSSQNGETVKTGDASRPVLYVLITVVSALGILLVSRKKRAELR